jgi:DNA-binding NarL/FixJ family response regulator
VILNADNNGFPERAPARGADFAAVTGHTAVAEAPSDRLTVLVGSDDPFTRQAFRTGARSPEIEVLADGTLEAVTEELASDLEPDIVLLDVQTTAAQALRAIQRIRFDAPGSRILACSAPAGTEFGLLCLSAGAWGYVSKEIDLEVLPRVLHALARGEAVIPRALATELVKRLARVSPLDRFEPSEISPPEARLLELLRTGSTLPEAAAELGVTVATARRHFGSVRRKLSVPPPASRRGAHGGRHRNHQLGVQ